MASELPLENALPVVGAKEVRGLKELTSLRAKDHCVHPVEAIEKNYDENRKVMRNFLLANIYGSHLPQTFQMEEAILSGLSSRVGLDILYGRHEKIGFEDYLNVPSQREEFPESFHTTMERKFGLL